MAVNWGLSGNNALNAFQTGYQIGDTLRQRNVERQTSNALSGLVADPAQDDAKFAELIRGLPAQSAQALINARNGMQAQSRQEQQQRRADLPFVGRLLGTVTDEASYQRARQTAQDNGLDLSSAPANYDPAWIDQQRQRIAIFSNPQAQQALTNTAKELVDAGYQYGTPEFQTALRARINAADAKTIPLQPGGTVAERDPVTGQVRIVVAQNPGGFAPGSPVQQGDIPRLTNPSEVSNLKPGQQFYDPNGVLRQVPGGPTQTASGGFR